MHNQPREPQSYEDCQAKSIQEFGWTSQGMDWGWGQVIKSTTHRRVEEFGYSCLQRCLTWTKRRRTGLLPSGPKSSFQMRASFVFHLETKVLESGGRVEKLIAQVAWSPVLSLNYFSLCAFNLFNTRVSQFELNYGKKWTFLIFCWICIL